MDIWQYRRLRAAATPLFHVSSARNRASILEHGLDWARMGAASGIAGSGRPEVDGCFLARDEHEAGFFVRMNNTGGDVDVWQVEGVDPDQLQDNGNGFLYLPATIPAGQLSLLRTEQPQPQRGGVS